MSQLAFRCLDVRPDRYAVVPTLLFRLRVEELTGEQVHAIALRCQLRVEPLRRRYAPDEGALLQDLFGDSDRWSDTMRPFQLASVAVMVQGFRGTTEVDLPVPVGYDLEVASTKYLFALDDGEVPLLLLFSGTVFTKGATGFAVEQVPWDLEDRHRMPVAVWRRLVDLHFPGSGWLRLQRETLQALTRYKAAHGLLSWDDVVTVLLRHAEVPVDGR